MFKYVIKIVSGKRVHIITDEHINESLPFDESVDRLVEIFDELVVHSIASDDIVCLNGVCVTGEYILVNLRSSEDKMEDFNEGDKIHVYNKLTAATEVLEYVLTFDDELLYFKNPENSNEYIRKTTDLFEFEKKEQL